MPSGSLVTTAYAPQTARGTQPTTPTFVTLRDSRVNGKPSRNPLHSEAMRADRAMLAPRLGKWNENSFSLPIELAFGAYDDPLARLLCSAWNTDVLKVGTTRSIVMLETCVTEIGATDGKYQRRLDCEFDSLDLTFAVDSLIKGNLTLVSGGPYAVADTAIASSSYGDPSDSRAMTIYDAAITVNSAVSSIITELKLNIKAGIKPFYTTAGAAARDASVGPCQITGSLTCELVDDVLTALALSEANTAISINIEDPDGQSYLISLPMVTLTDVGGVEVPGPDTLTQTFTFEASYDDTSESPIVITRDDGVA